MSGSVGSMPQQPRLGMRELESRILDALWRAEEPLAPAEVKERLEADHPLAYTTVNTVLVRLWEKGALDRSKRSRAYEYSPRESRAEYFAHRMNEILETSGDHHDALASFVETMDSGDRRALRRLLQRGRRR